MMRFEEDEYIMMAMFQRDSRLQTMNEIRGILPFAEGDEEIINLANTTLEKLGRISDKEFLNLDLEPYMQEPVEEQE